MKKHLIPTLFLFVLSMLMLPSCQSPKDLVFKEFKNLSLDKMSFAGADLKVDLVYYNPNNFGLSLNRTDLDIYVDSTFLGHSSQDIQVSIPKRDNFTIPLKINLDMKNLLKNSLSSFVNKQVSIRAVGSVKVGKAGVYKSFPVDYTTVQTFSMFK
jgi:LEA14-like dessication related protein